MPSSMFGIYTAQRSLQLNQAAINLINNNIANINTPGYSKERLELSQKVVMSTGSNIGAVAAQMGVGSMVDTVTRNRETYFDNYYRSESTTFNYYKELDSNISLIEDAANELEEGGISDAFIQFYDASHKLSMDPVDSVTRTNFVQKAMDLTRNFNDTANQLTSIQENLVGTSANPGSLGKSKLGLITSELNTKFDALIELNRVIGLSSAMGTAPNGLMDERDRLLDKIAEYVPITVTEKANNNLSISIGNYEILDGDTKHIEFGVEFNTEPMGTEGVYDPTVITLTRLEDDLVINSNANDLFDTGQIAGVLDSVRYDFEDPDKLTTNNIMTKLNKLAQEFAEAVNSIQISGKYIIADENRLSDPVNNPDELPENIFVDGAGDVADITAASITVNKDIVKDVFKIAAAQSDNSLEKGDGSNALAIAQLRNEYNSELENATFEDFLSSVVGKIGIESSSIKQSYEAQDAIMKNIKTKRESIMGVNLDEELTDLLKYQRAYEASAKVLNTVSKSLETIINMV